MGCEKVSVLAEATFDNAALPIGETDFLHKPRVTQKSPSYGETKRSEIGETTFSYYPLNCTARSP